jgi:hypothetical protein
MPCSRQTSRAVKPFSACFRIAMTLLSENLGDLIAERSSFLVENSTSDPVYLQREITVRAPM